jgi:hypothetical protein
VADFRVPARIHRLRIEDRQPLPGLSALEAERRLDFLSAGDDLMNAIYADTRRFPPYPQVITDFVSAASATRRAAATRTCERSHDAGVHHDQADPDTTLAPGAMAVTDWKRASRARSTARGWGRFLRTAPASCHLHARGRWFMDLGSKTERKG